MYEAIVFLPLIGSILAGVISLLGAHARHRDGQVPSLGAKDHASNHVRDHEIRGAPSPLGDVAAIKVSHDEPHRRQPPAQGSVAAEVITTALLMLSCVLSLVAFVSVGFLHQDARVTLATFILSGDLKVAWALRIDPLTAVMLVVVTTVSALVHLYSIGYMDDDPHRPRFFSYLSLFTFAMLVLVTADNLVQLFFGWRALGLRAIS